ncbi:unnamed protein product, partial [Ranitomeya imitator]
MKPLQADWKRICRSHHPVSAASSDHSCAEASHPWSGVIHNVRGLLIYGGDHSQCVEASHPWRGSLTMCGGFSSMEGITHNVWRLLIHGGVTHNVWGLLIHGGDHSQCAGASHPWRGSLTMCGGFSSME